MQIFKALQTVAGAFSDLFLTFFLSLKHHLESSQVHIDYLTGESAQELLHPAAYLPRR